MKSLSENTLSWLEGRGCGAALEDGRIKNTAAVVRCFQEAFPGEGIWSDRAGAYLAALADCLSVMNEMLYLEYRAMCDLFRRFVALYLARAPWDDPVWQGALSLGDALGQVDPSQLCRRPHKN